MVTSTIDYIGGLRTKAVHINSEKEIITDAPVDNEGRGEYFSPTDIVATALGSCMLTIMGIAAKKYNFTIDGTKADVTKVMGVNPRRITEVIINMKFPEQNYSDKEKTILKVCADTCPVAKSLHPDLKQTVNLIFQ